MKSIGEQIIYARELRNMKQKDLAEAIGVTKATMSKYENNINIPNAYILAKIADALNTSTDYLVGRSSHISPYPTNEFTEYSPENLLDVMLKLNDKNKIRIFERMVTLWEQQSDK